MKDLVSIGQFLRPAEVSAAVKLHDKLSKTGKLATTICKEIILPNIDRINRDLGGENIPLYLAFCVEDAITKAKEVSRGGKTRVC
jgi:hypothetical protein